MGHAAQTRVAVPGPAEVFRTLGDRIDRALQAAPVAAIRIAFGGAEIALRVPDDALANDLCTAFLAPSGVRSGRPSLTLDCFRSSVWAEVTSGLGASSDGRYVRHADAGLCAALDLEDDRLVAAVDGPSLPASERARPLNLLLGVWLTARGVWPVHAGAVAAAGRAALFLGAGGSGKSTTALLSARSLDFVGDDLVALRFGAGAIEARPLYATAALDDAHLGRVAPELLLLPTPGSTEDGKRILRVREQAARGGDVVALVLPRVVSQPRCRLVPARPREALLAAAPSSLLRRAVPAHGLLARLRELVERVPCYRLELGTRVADVPDLVLRAIEGRA